ncbi:hypothetical protein QAD02_016301 [Eretmocerus hayati]|uniref:Uncharacterized protein n=1 Tax=Eretmocerus hayati TaxID=131215 RepID=A0ACC2PA73_9HYME|nr:hypothetical protein QAD02_016301 [Eretmocerus hayati]
MILQQTVVPPYIDIILFVVLLVAFSSDTYHHSNHIGRSIQDSLMMLSVCLLIFILFILFYKMIIIFSELLRGHVENAHDLISLLTNLNFNSHSWILISITVCSLLLQSINLNQNIYRASLDIVTSSPLTMCWAFFSSLILVDLINMFHCRVSTVATIFSSGGLDPGTAMACSYFYGYLKILLPASGGIDRKGILHAMETYEGNHNVKIPVKKLFILIPSSSYIPPDLREISSDWLESAQMLDTVAIDRAGVKNRTYHNTIYILHSKGPNEKKTGIAIHLAVEGATPLKTFSETQHSVHRYAPLYREFNQEIIHNFYTTLKDLLEDNPDCRDYCELVYYEDNVDGHHVNPAHVLLERLAKYNVRA